MKDNNIFGFRPNGFNIPRKVVIAYLAVFGGVCALFLLMGRELPAMLALCIGLCVFVLTDVLLDQKKGVQGSFFHRVHGMITCAFTGAAIMICLVKLVECF